MVGELIRLPLRATGLAARVSWRAAGRTLSLASEVAGYVVVRVGPGRSDDHLAGPWTEAPSAPSVQPGPAPSPKSATSQPTSTASLPPAEPIRPRATEPQPVGPAEEPAHVSEEPELVEELAEPGAEDGAGPELHIREPWDGYRHMNAQEVTDRLSGASAAELAAIELYESTTRRRRSVMAAVERQLRATSGQGARA